MMQKVMKPLVLTASMALTSMAVRIDDPMMGTPADTVDAADTFNLESASADSVNTLGTIESSVAGLTSKEEQEAVTAKNKADSEMTEARLAGQRAFDEDQKSQQALVDSRFKSSNAQAELTDAERQARDANVAISSAHMHGVTLSSLQTLHDISERSAAKEKIILEQSQHRVQTLKSAAIETINQGHANADARIKSLESDDIKEIHESESIAAKSVREYQQSMKLEGEERVKTHAANAAKRIQEAQAAAEFRKKRSVEQMNTDVKRIDETTANQLEVIREKIAHTTAMVAQQVHNNEDASNRHISTLETAARSTISRGEAQAEETIRDNDMRIERQVREQERVVAEKHSRAEKAIKDINVDADARIMSAQSEATQASVKAESSAKTAIQEMLEKRSMRSVLLARAAETKVRHDDHSAIVAQETQVQKKKIEERKQKEVSEELAEAKIEEEKAAKLEIAATSAQIKFEEVSVKASRGTNDEAFPVSLAAAQAHQKAQDYSNYAKFESARAKSEQDRVGENPEKVSRITIDASMEPSGVTPASEEFHPVVDEEVH